jgi:predicted alpha/beta superfamily hydrolase
VKLALAATLASVVLGGCAAAAPEVRAGEPTAAAGQPIVLGQAYTLPAPSLGDQRTVNVALPFGYADHPERRYPVLYLIDGGVDQDFVHIVGTEQLGAMWGRNAQPIIVGIASKDRRRELIGPTGDAKLRAQYPTAGDSAKFRTFLRDELKPFVAAHFRTDGTSGVIGESLAGLFIVETWLREPSLFDNYAAISPSMWWDDGALSREAAMLVGDGQAGTRLYLAAEDEGAEYQAHVDRFVAALGKAHGWCYAQPQATHATIYHAVSPAAIQFLFPPAEAPDPQFGFEVQCSQKS